MWGPPPTIQEADSGSSDDHQDDDQDDDQDNNGQGQHNDRQGQRYNGHGQQDPLSHLRWLQEDDLGIDMAEVDPFPDISHDNMEEGVRVPGLGGGRIGAFRQQL